MKFEEQFPSLQRLGKAHYIVDVKDNAGLCGISNIAIMENCLDKQRHEELIVANRSEVFESMNKALKEYQQKVEKAIKKLEADEGRVFPTIYEELGLKEWI